MKQLKVIILILATVISAILYRLGGIGKPFKTWMRDWIIPAVSFAVMIFVLKIKAPWYIHLISYGVMGGALTTYWDKIFGYDNYYTHGAGIALAYLPYVLVGAIPIVAFLIRVVVLALSMGLWCKYNENDKIEEFGRGAFIIATLLVFIKI